ncbi:MAG: carboxymuconolactone decarboxylase family protein, partial [Rhodospirillaceae bacterium]|nr:carboxymuconolactone decarboxylase family protein [Rhodospirillaceae bacterium]
QFENRDEEVLYDFASELMADKSVTDKTYAAALAEFGEATVVELVAVLGYYTSVAMVLNAFEELPADGALPLST